MKNFSICLLLACLMNQTTLLSQPTVVLQELPYYHVPCGGGGLVFIPPAHLSDSSCVKCADWHTTLVSNNDSVRQLGNGGVFIVYGRHYRVTYAVSDDDCFFAESSTTFDVIESPGIPWMDSTTARVEFSAVDCDSTRVIFTAPTNDYPCSQREWTSVTMSDERGKTVWSGMHFDSLNQKEYIGALRQGINYTIWFEVFGTGPMTPHGSGYLMTCYKKLFIPRNPLCNQATLGVFPNPANTMITLVNPGNHVAIYDILGQVLCEAPADPAPGSESVFDVSRYAVGVYLATSTLADGTTQTKRFIIAR